MTSKYTFSHYYNEKIEYQPSHKYFKNLSYWEFHHNSSWFYSEVIMLIMNIDPWLINPPNRHMRTRHNKQDHDKNVYENLKSGLFQIGDNGRPTDDSPEILVEMIYRALLSNELRAELSPNDDDTGRSHYRVRPTDFITWADSKELKIPDQFADLIYKPPAGTPPYLDPRHQYYSKELAAAIKAWLYLYHEGNLDESNKKHTEQIEKWVQENYSDDPDLLSQHAIDRIRTIVNTQKRGINHRSKTELK